MFWTGWRSNSMRKRQQQTTEKVMTMSKDDEEALCTSILQSRHLGQSKNHEKTHHWTHATCWWSMMMTLKPRDAQHDALKTTRSSSSTSSDQFAKRYCSHQCSARPQKKIAVYSWIFKSSTKLWTQRIKNQVNRSFLQAVMAKSSKVVRSENFWTARKTKVKRA